MRFKNHLKGTLFPLVSNEIFCNSRFFYSNWVVLTCEIKVYDMLNLGPILGGLGALIWR